MKLNGKSIFLCLAIFHKAIGYSMERPSHLRHHSPDVLRSRLFLSSSIAITMLIMSPDSSHGVDDYFLLRQQSQDPIKVKAMRELRELKMLQDSRLDSCVERGKDWEHCFMFGDSKSQDTRQTKPSGASKDSQRFESKQRPPTW
mmetsp:Transcript_12582/g.23593  ORF Transcript_12582/g.23593 Transcript_12582/m.23593 type:complete len:144 (+) Transcript_12582:281-712(+)